MNLVRNFKLVSSGELTCLVVGERYDSSVLDLLSHELLTLQEQRSSSRTGDALGVRVGVYIR